MAEVVARQGNPSLALAMLEQAIELVDQISERFFEAELHRIKGEVILLASEKETHEGGSGAAQAEQSFRDAIAIANRQRARTFQLRAATSLSRLQMKRSQNAEAREILREVYSSFGEGIESIDLTEARNLLLALD